MTAQAQALPENLNLAALPPEILQDFLKQLPVDVLKKAANESEKSRSDAEKALEQLENEVTVEVSTALIEYSKEGERLKAWAFEKLKPVLDLRMQVYEIKDKKIAARVRNQKSHTFNGCKDGKNHSVTIGRRSKDTFKSTVKNGIAKVEEYIKSKGIDEDISSILVDLIEKEKAGSINTSTVMLLKNKVEALREKGINEPLLEEGVRIISEAWDKKLTCFYIEPSKEDGQSKMIKYPLNLSAHPLPENFDFQYFQDEEKA